MNRDRERLLDILEAIANIERYSVRGRPAFDADELLQTWMVRQLQIIGEAARALSPGVRDAHPDIPWSLMIGMRHVLVHGYDSVDIDEVWATIDRDIGLLKSQIEGMLAAE